MIMTSSLYNNVEKLRVKMIRIARERGNLLDDHVIRASQELDELLFQVQFEKESMLQTDAAAAEEVLV